MNKAEILLVHSRLKHAINNCKLLYRKPIKDRNHRALIKARESIRTLNSWLSSEPEANTVIRRKMNREAAALIKDKVITH